MRWPDPETRFKSYIKKTKDCYIWIGPRNSDGYGKFDITINGIRKAYSAHKYIYARANNIKYEDIPKEIEICHICDNPPCVRLKHLFAGTRQLNMDDMVIKGRSAVQYGEHNGRAKLTRKDVSKIKKLNKTGFYTQRELATKFNISPTNISFIVNNLAWTRINDE